MLLTPLLGSTGAIRERNYRRGILKALASLRSACSRSIGTLLTFTGIRKPPCSCSSPARASGWLGSGTCPSAKRCLGSERWQCRCLYCGHARGY